MNEIEFERLVRDHDLELRRLAYRLLGDRDRMDDVLQEAYLKAYRALPRFRGEAAVGTWLYRIVYNACVDAGRRSRDVVALDSVRELADPAPTPFEATFERRRLAAALGALSAEDRAAVLLVDAQGFDYGAAAEVLGVPPGTIGSRLNRARRILRRALDARAEGAS